ncbi:hypothetical protein ABPG77_003390 [Micractinium sp. CCAP 211/92]
MAVDGAAGCETGGHQYGGSWALVRQMWDKKQVRGWTYTPILGETKLLAQKDAIENWGEFSEANGLSGWSNGTPVCEWSGVACSKGGHVVELDLSCGGNITGGMCAVQAVGSLAAELSTIKTLEALSVAGQALTGPLPAVWGVRGAFKSLLVLDLSGNNLTGTVPASWGGPAAFPELEHILLGGNPELCGKVPASLQPKLECLGDAEGCTNGSLPACPLADWQKTPRKEVCIQPDPLPDVPSWMKEYDPWLAAKPDAEEQRRNNKRLVQTANDDGTRYDMVMYGDSITWKASTYPSVWNSFFGGLGGPSAALGVIFSRVSDLAYRITSGDELFTLPPKVVVLLIGVNNIERGPQPADELDGLIKWLKQAYPGTHFIVLNLLPTHVDVPLDTQGTNEQYQRVAAENGVQFSTCGSDIDPADRYQLYDGIHPTPRGLDTLFSCLAPQVEAAVARSPC